MTSMPASAHSRATVEACTSEPPASTSSRSRHASMWMRRSPADAAARSPSFGLTKSLGGPPGVESCATGSVNYRLRAGPKGASCDSPASVPSRARPPTRCWRSTPPATARCSTASAPGRFLDIGCGLGDGSALFLGGGRTVFGVDYDPDHRHRRPPVARATSAPRRVTARRSQCARARRLGVLVAPHRALPPARGARRRVGPGARRRRGGVLHHAERARRLREPVPRVPLRARRPAPDARAATSRTSPCSASTATPR